MGVLAKDQKCYLVDVLPLPVSIPKATQIQFDEVNCRLALILAIAEYYMAD